MARSPLKRALRPAFVVVAASAVACGSGDVFGPSDDPSDDPFDNRPKETISHNPPPPPPPEPPRPNFGATVTQADPPPALGAATVVSSADGATAVASDPDRDRVLVVDLAKHVSREVALAHGDEPGRIALDDQGRAHVVLRRAGAVATIDLAGGKVVERRAACAAPRGIAHAKGTLYIACAGGELVTLAAGTGAAKTLAMLDRDLRDVVVTKDKLLVSRFRSAEVLSVGMDGKVLSRIAPEPVASREAAVGWRLVASGDSAVMVHQMAAVVPVQVERPQSYAGLDPCGGPVTSHVTSFEWEASALTGDPLGDAVLPIDVAVTSDGKFQAVIAAGNGHTAALPQLLRSSAAPRTGGCQPDQLGGAPPGQLVAVTYTKDDALVILSREPAALHVQRKGGSAWTSIDLGGASREDTGHAILHSNTGGRIACASCHPEGGEDGHVWSFSDVGKRRTQSLRGTLDGTAPYHWDGKLADLAALTNAAFVGRMGGQQLSAEQTEALRSWMVKIPTLPRSPVDAAAAARGKALFEGESAGCAGCHSGPKLTNNKSVDLGNGAALQVPPLVGLSLRAPYFHDGCAPTLGDNAYKSCGGDKHEALFGLSPQGRTDLVTYLDSL